MITVSDLIAHLQRADQNVPVYLTHYDAPDSVGECLILADELYFLQPEPIADDEERSYGRSL